MMDLCSEYERQHNVRFIEKLGDGKDGQVFKTLTGQAVKFFNDAAVYHRELRAYQILRQRNIEEISGFQIPRLIRRSDPLRAIEMTVVEVPFILDFASAYTTEEYEHLDFTQDVLDEAESRWAETFGDRWPTVQAICDRFTSETGLILLDLSVNNIRFGDQ